MAAHSPSAPVLAPASADSDAMDAHAQPALVAVAPGPRPAGERARAACRRAWRFWWDNFLPLGLVLSFVLGAAFPQPGAAMARTDASKVLVSIIFFLAGLALKTDEVARALKAWRGSLFGCVSILFATPLVGLVVVRLPMSSSELVIGLAVFFAMPSTLNSALVLTRLANGNVALALLLTVATNTLGVLTIPFMLPFVTAAGGEGRAVALDVTTMLSELALTIVLPLAVGKCARRSERVCAFAAAYNVQLKHVSSFCLILIPWQKISTSRDKLGSLSAPDIVAVTACACAVHLLFMAFNLGASRALRLPLFDTKAVVLMASSKTLTTAVVVVDLLPRSLGEPGLMLIAIIIAHFSQIMIDAVIVPRWAAVASPRAAAARAPSSSSAVPLEPLTSASVVAPGHSSEGDAAHTSEHAHG